MSLVSKVGWFMRYMMFFSGIDDVRAFSTLRKNQVAPAAKGGPQEVALNLRRKPGATLFCRPGTSDAEVLWDVFWGKYHLPADPLAEKPVIFDLGANVGFSCFDFGTLYPHARVFGVELDQDNVAMARRNTAALGARCEIVHAAIWSENGEVTYSKSDEEWGYHISGDQDASSASQVTVRAISIDTLMQEVGVDWIDFMKMDIEGAEHAVLDPQAGWLQRTGALNLEVHAPATIENCTEILSQAGFTCQRSPRHKSAILAKRPPAAR
ncbi:FkbM family methyltransferase [uncultured Roseobacter sp.]|uniref:FkbM family methyltransferase n=1 Tax=uncultured Roseobacter sp. TaxID=114847 RepID=UPI00260C354E|nr:FkbM family methyltransferase [uncultured Roseobacter sp.]